MRPLLRRTGWNTAAQLSGVSTALERSPFSQATKSSTVKYSDPSAVVLSLGETHDLPVMDDGDGHPRHLLAGHLGADELVHAAGLRPRGSGHQHEQPRTPGDHPHFRASRDMAERYAAGPSTVNATATV